MTEAEAIKFLQKCERYMLTREKLPIGKSISIIRRSGFSLMTSGSLFLMVAANLYSNGHSSFWVVSGTAGLLLYGCSIWSLIRLRQARLVLSYTTDDRSRLAASKK
jgi:Na+/proline symporter